MKRSRTRRMGLIVLATLLLDSPGAAFAMSVATDIDEQVARLIEKALDSNAQAQAFVELEALGCEAVPFIIRHLDDRRPLPYHQISLENKSPDAFEGLRHYGPEQVVDALAAILNQVTGKSFGFIYNGASDDDRAATVKGWSEHLERVGPKGVCDSHGT